LYSAGAAPKEGFGDEYARSEVIACKEQANVAVDGDSIRFKHGDCVLFNWEPIAVSPPQDPPANNDTDASADAMKAKFADDDLRNPDHPLHRAAS
jgi:hypothetical protein